MVGTRNGSNYDYQRPKSYTALFYELVELLKEMRDEHGVKLKLLGLQAVSAVNKELDFPPTTNAAAARRVQRRPYHKLYFRICEILKLFKLWYRKDPQHIFDQAVVTAESKD